MTTQAHSQTPSKKLEAAKSSRSLRKRGLQQARKPKDERITAQLAPIYKTGFYIMAVGITFDIFTRYNYLAQTDASGSASTTSTLETAVLFAACAAVLALMARHNVYSDSLCYTEARTFLETGVVAPTLGLAALVSLAAVGGRLYSEIRLLGFGGVTWLGDFAMMLVMLVMFGALLLALQYLTWKSYRNREDRVLMTEDDE